MKSKDFKLLEENTEKILWAFQVEKDLGYKKHTTERKRLVNLVTLELK